ncbi:MAG: hypothetical protein LBQ67_02850 [Treponema sp.]|jgi:hypothetical protein|nr:hypothetical protein [Treponema sp.]
MKRTVLFCATLWVICFAAPAFAENKAMPQFAIPTAKSNGMGGSHVAYTDNVFALLVNPAAIMRVEQRSFFALSPTLLNPQTTFGLIGPFQDAAGGDMSTLGDEADILSKQKGKIPLGFDLREFPLSFAWVADGFGFGLWDRIFVNPNIIGTHVDLNVYADVILPVGFAFRILDTEAHDVDVGVTAKPFVRVIGREKVDILELMDNDDILDTIAVPVIAGAGVNLGLLYRWDIGLRAGVTFDDIFTRGVVVSTITGEDDETYYVPFTINAGLAYDFKIGRFWKTAPGFLANMGFTLAFDWRDIVNAFQQDDYQKRNTLLDMGAGFQVSLYDMFMLRIGMNEMLPSFGFGFDLGPLEIDLAYYGKELGLEPGLLSTAAVDVTIALRPGAKKRNWPWTRRSLVGLFTGSH